MQFHLDIDKAVGELSVSDYVLTICKSCRAEVGVPFGVAYDPFNDNPDEEGHLDKVPCRYCGAFKLYPEGWLEDYAASLGRWWGPVMCFGLPDWFTLEVVPEPETAAA